MTVQPCCLLSRLGTSRLNIQYITPAHPDISSHVVISQTPTLKLTLWETDSSKSRCSIHVVKPSKVKAENVWSVFVSSCQQRPLCQDMQADIKDTNTHKEQNTCSLWSPFNCWSYELFVNPTDLQLSSEKRSILFYLFFSLVLSFMAT